MSGWGRYLFGFDSTNADIYIILGRDATSPFMIGKISAPRPYFLEHVLQAELHLPHVSGSARDYAEPRVTVDPW